MLLNISVLRPIEMTKAIDFAMKRDHVNVIFELPRQYFDSTIQHNHIQNTQYQE